VTFRGGTRDLTSGLYPTQISL